ncbi:NUDIX hydrolase [Actinomyces minihominis]|uniref:NUDIX hydrolase n=1 Tax=Actinomyces minihominis TaxID=2002838 RepID=UPI000C08CAED|nr:NUDIX hydrolase [Actinomyces minihominis]
MASRALVFPKGMVRSAGAVVWRAVPGVEIVPGQPLAPTDLEFLLVHRPRYRDWGWPKGKAETNETLPAAAVREVEEETGYAVTLGTPLTTQRYRLGSGHLKEVYYWTGMLLEDKPALASRKPVKRAPKKEIDIVQWVSPARARLMLTRRGDRRLLTEVINRAGRGELITSTTVILRHARAVDRAKWDGKEGMRPLSRLGGAQALDLVPLMSAFGIDVVHSSPWMRCVQTVVPYSAVGGAKFKTHAFLTEKAVNIDPGPSSALVEKLLNKPKGARAVSMHRPGYQALLAPIRDITPRRMMALIEQPKKNLDRAEMLVIHVSHASAPRVIGVERHQPLTKFSLG